MNRADEWARLGLVHMVAVLKVAYSCNLWYFVIIFCSKKLTQWGFKVLSLSQSLFDGFNLFKVSSGEGHFRTVELLCPFIIIDVFG